MKTITLEDLKRVGCKPQSKSWRWVKSEHGGSMPITTEIKTQAAKSALEEAERAYRNAQDAYQKARAAFMAETLENLP